MVVIVFCVFALLASACTSDETPSFGEPVAIDGALPSVSGPEIPGSGSFSPSRYQGDVTVVNFWATWCTPCREEQPVLENVWAKYQDRGVSVVGVNYKDDDAAAKEWLRTYDVSYPSVVDSTGAYASDFAFPGLPATYVADSEGRLRYRFYGAVTEQQLGSVIDEVLAESPDGATA